MVPHELCKSKDVTIRAWDANGYWKNVLELESGGGRTAYSETHLFSNNSKSIRVVSILVNPLIYVTDIYCSNCKKGCPRSSLPCLNPVKKNESTEWLRVCCSGYSVDLLMKLNKLLNFESELYLVEDYKYGVFHNATSYNGMVGDVFSGKADIAVSGLSITHNRIKYVDFTSPFMAVDIGIVTKEHDFSFVEQVLADLPIKKIYWSVMLVLFGAVTVTFSLEIFSLRTKNLVNQAHFGWKSFVTYSVLESYAFIAGLTFQRSIGGASPISLSPRVFALIFAFGMMIIVAVFTASLTVQQVISHFEGIEDSKVNIFLETKCRLIALKPRHFTRISREILVICNIKKQNEARQTDK